MDDREAAKAAMRVRRACGVASDRPVCGVDLALEQGVIVRFHDVPSMEGMFLDKQPAEIWLPADRPVGRQQFGCAHELGHRTFGHGTQLDEYLEPGGQRGRTREEHLADAFAVHLLMPQRAVDLAFRRRGWSPATATAVELYRISCALGVSYAALVGRLSNSLGYVGPERAERLRRTGLGKIREDLLGRALGTRVLPVDEHWGSVAADLWAGDHLLLPQGSELESDVLRHVASLDAGELVIAVRRGTTRVGGSGWAAFVRVCPPRYVGLARFRHLEDDDDD